MCSCYFRAHFARNLKDSPGKRELSRGGGRGTVRGGGVGVGRQMSYRVDGDKRSPA